MSPRAVRLGPAEGRLVLRTRREGLAAKVGHDLTIEVTRWWAEVTPDLAVTAEVDLSSLVVRSGEGGVVPLTDSDRTEIHATIGRILGDGTARFTSTGSADEGGGNGSVEGTLTLHGVSRPLRLLVRGAQRVTGSVVQSAHGITPYRAFLGALKLRDEVEVELVLSVPFDTLPA